MKVFDDLRVYWVPTSSHGRLSGQHFLLLSRQEQLPNISLALVGSRKRRAHENFTQRAAVATQIQLGWTYPADTLPSFVKDAFKAVDQVHRAGTSNSALCSHYALAEALLTRSLQRPAVDIFLIVLWIVYSASVALTVGADGTFITPKTKQGQVVRVDQKHLVAMLATKMVWYLCPEEFVWHATPPHAAPKPTLLTVGDMVKKIGKQAVILTLGHHALC
jgi:hypothetical protein